MASIVDGLDTKVAKKSLLKHPFYQAWQRGELTLDDLRNYAAQYYLFERYLPTFLSSIHTNCPFVDTQKTILENLWDEQHGAEDHRILWIDFAKSLGLGSDDLLLRDRYDETLNLVATYSLICSQAGIFFVEGLAAIYVYEKQVPEIARVKMQGLKQFYGITDEKALKFFAVHSELDKEHSLREAEALERHVALGDTQLVRHVEVAADRALSAWWNFLDGIENRRE